MNYWEEKEDMKFVNKIKILKSLKLAQAQYFLWFNSSFFTTTRTTYLPLKKSWRSLLSFLDKIKKLKLSTEWNLG